VGVGPFVFKEWESGSHLTFVANPKWHKPPKLEQIFIRIVPDDAAQEAAIIAGDADIGVYLSSDQIDKLEAGGKVKVLPNQSGYNEAWFLNVDPKTAHPAMLDVNVRKAIALATDRFTIVKDLLKESINPVNATYWDMLPPYGDANIKPYPYDPDQAKKLLDEAGWKVGADGIREKVIDGKTVKLKLRYITNQREIRKNVQAVVQQQWAKVGIAADLVNYSSDVYFNGYKDGGPQALGKYEIAEYSSVPNSFPDPDSSDNWLCSGIPSDQNPTGINNQGYCDPKMDDLLNQQATSPDREARIKLYSQIEQLMYDQVIYIGIWKDPDLYSVSSRLQNVRFAGASPFWNADEWTVTP
jgi:peptide/nickel transport system substrate-binding protein